MIPQAPIGLNSRSEVNVFNVNDMLPLITAPMSSVVDETNYKLFLDNKINVCLPRTIETVFWEDGVFISISLNDFTQEFLVRTLSFIGKRFVCIDTANGNMPALHNAIEKAKEIHGDNLIIMAGNVASEEAFVELAKTGVDYIRVGIGGGGGCNTTSNTGVGQEDLENLILMCKRRLDWIDIEKVKIVADGISSYINYCKRQYGFNDNGYAAINKLLYAGADLVMIGKLFAECVESAGEKLITKKIYFGVNNNYRTEEFTSFEKCNKFYNYNFNSPNFKKFKNDFLFVQVKYSGMSTQVEQQNYNDTIKPSEGSVNWIDVRWSLNDWLCGNTYQDESPYLMGYANSLKSAMSYTGSKTLTEFKKY